MLIRGKVYRIKTKNFEEFTGEATFCGGETYSMILMKGEYGAARVGDIISGSWDNVDKVKCLS